jgi:inner membrane protein
MDSITQFVLGASVGIALSPKKTPKVAIISGCIATLPDLDILLDYGNDLDNIVNHRTFSHAFFYLTIFTPFLAIILAKFFKFMSFYRWWFLTWLVLITHIILDAFTIFGTGLFLPFNDMRVMIGSIFIIDPLYTLPLLFSLIYLLIKKQAKYNKLALIISTIYLIWTFIVQSFLIPNGKSFATPTPFNSFLWRVVEVESGSAKQYFVNIFGQKSTAKSIKLNHNLSNINPGVIKKYANFSSGFYRLEVKNNQLILSDLRMGNIFHPVFSFIIATKVNGAWQQIKPQKLQNQLSFANAFK